MNNHVTRRFAACFIAALAMLSRLPPASAADQPTGVKLARPTSQQYAWQDAKLGIMFCFDLITFTDLREPNCQKAGELDPSLYNPTQLDTDQWMECAKAMGATYMVFVAKWCTGHLQW